MNGPLVADFSMDHKPWILYVSKWDLENKANTKYLFSKDGFYPFQ